MFNRVSSSFPKYGEMNSTSLELSFKSHFVCLYMYVCNHVRMLIVQIDMFKPKYGHLATQMIRTHVTGSDFSI